MECWVPQEQRYGQMGEGPVKIHEVSAQANLKKGQVIKLKISWSLIPKNSDRRGLGEEGREPDQN